MESKENWCSIDPKIYEKSWTVTDQFLNLKLGLRSLREEVIGFPLRKGLGSPRFIRFPDPLLDLLPDCNGRWWELALWLMGRRPFVVVIPYLTSGTLGHLRLDKKSYQSLQKISFKG